MSNPHPSLSAARKGGQARTARKLAALRALYDRRRGVRLHDPGAQWPATRGQVLRLLDTAHARGSVSIRALAESLRVSDRTLRRWLRGEDYPTAQASAAVARWLKRHA